VRWCLRSRLWFQGVHALVQFSTLLHLKSRLRQSHYVSSLALLQVYVVPNSVFSRTVVLNVTRKGKEWRVFEYVGIRVEDFDAVPNIISDMRIKIRQVCTCRLCVDDFVPFLCTT
jgi:hypothetical protein